MSVESVTLTSPTTISATSEELLSTEEHFDGESSLVSHSLDVEASDDISRIVRVSDNEEDPGKGVSGEGEDSIPSMILEDGGNSPRVEDADESENDCEFAVNEETEETQEDMIVLEEETDDSELFVGEYDLSGNEEEYSSDNEIVSSSDKGNMHMDDDDDEEEEDEEEQEEQESEEDAEKNGEKSSNNKPQELSKKRKSEQQKQSGVESSNFRRPFNNNNSVRGRRPLASNARNGFQPRPFGNNNRALHDVPQQQQQQVPRPNIPQRYYKSDKADEGSSATGFISNWGHRSNLIDQNGNFQRATTDLKNYIASYKAKYFFYFDLVNGRYPQFVRKFQNNLEIWRMSFNVYASGFAEYITHLGEIHAFYQMEFVDNELRWVYKDFNFYPNKMRYGFRVNSFDIADVHSRFVKFICLRDCIIKQFPYVNIQHKIFIFRKFDENLRTMMNRLNQVKLSGVVTNGSGEIGLAGGRPAQANASRDHSPESDVVVSSTAAAPLTPLTVGANGGNVNVTTNFGPGGDGRPGNGYISVRFRKEKEGGMTFSEAYGGPRHFKPSGFTHRGPPALMPMHVRRQMPLMNNNNGGYPFRPAHPQPSVRGNHGHFRN